MEDTREVIATLSDSEVRLLRGAYADFTQSAQELMLAQQQAERMVTAAQEKRVIAENGYVRLRQAVTGNTEPSLQLDFDSGEAFIMRNGTELDAPKDGEGQ